MGRYKGGVGSASGRASVSMHGKVQGGCRECIGSRFCAHGKVQGGCRECIGSRFCEHGKVWERCKDCARPCLAVDRKVGDKCDDFSESSICEHDLDGTESDDSDISRNGWWHDPSKVALPNYRLAQALFGKQGGRRVRPLDRRAGNYGHPTPSLQEHRERRGWLHEGGYLRHYGKGHDAFDRPPGPAAATHPNIRPHPTTAATQSETPEGALPPHAGPPHAYPPYVAPTLALHARPSQAFPPHMRPPHAFLPHMRPPQAFVPNTRPPQEFPPHMQPPHNLPPHALPPEAFVP
uniref:TNFR-Cys domain-containing protein n=1 Tax=Chromera velia CCMP2878 TaxID=1169474 RepID=A0A0G4FA17_9ALVE|eukprot:Cvel_3016.t1-p1 / transcript=Cvel_3016.t1 / gene=Cvel_3016 / organism=Chromera_velia_CCMP2878 / gene_product=hypothetical protein / transcript_product=hypothetical protein / location=Cvel_scaffold120:49114-49986(+) / protein_length=291 / sequence_SO=supercontig / SO=protein_coding / is_pseudo=false